MTVRSKSPTGAIFYEQRKIKDKQHRSQGAVSHSDEDTLWEGPFPLHAFAPCNFDARIPRLVNGNDVLIKRHVKFGKRKRTLMKQMRRIMRGEK